MASVLWLRTQSAHEVRVVRAEWLFRPDQQAPQPLSQSVTAGQRAVYVTVAVQGSGQGNASETVTLQVLGPEFRAASAGVVVSCR